MGIVQEFKEFAVKGNMLDMAVGIIIGASFGKVVTSLVNDVIMPPIGMALGRVNFNQLGLVLKEEVRSPEGVVTDPAVAIRYGAFLQNIIDFLIVAFCIFLVVKAMNRIIRKREAGLPA